MTAMLALIRKDLHLFLGNRRSLMMSVMAPILIAAFFGSLFGRDSKVSMVPVAVTDLDRSELSARIVASLRADASISLSELPADQALEQVRAGKLRAALTLPQGFAERAPRAFFGVGPKPEIVLVFDPSQATVLPLVRGLLAQHVMQPVSQSAFSLTANSVPGMREQIQQSTRMEPTQRSELVTMFDSIARVRQHSAGSVASAAPGAASGAAGSTGLGQPFSTREIEAAGSDALRQKQGAGYNSYAHAFAGMGVQFILLMGVDVGVTYLLLRRSALWLRLRAAPLSRAQLLGSRMLSCALIAFGVFIVVFGVAIAVFGVRIYGSWVGLLAVMAAFALMTASFGLMIAAIGRTPEATRGLAIMVTLLLVMVGGAWVPSFLFPPWLQTVAAWTPVHWAVEGLDAMSWRAQPLASALMPVAVLLGFAAAFAAIALSRFRWNE